MGDDTYRGALLSRRELDRIMDALPCRKSTARLHDEGILRDLFCNQRSLGVQACVRGYKKVSERQETPDVEVYRSQKKRLHSGWGHTVYDTVLGLQNKSDSLADAQKLLSIVKNRDDALERCTTGYVMLKATTIAKYRNHACVNQYLCTRTQFSSEGQVLYDEFFSGIADSLVHKIEELKDPRDIIGEDLLYIIRKVKKQERLVEVLGTLLEKAAKSEELETIVDAQVERQQAIVQGQQYSARLDVLESTVDALEKGRSETRNDILGEFAQLMEGYRSALTRAVRKVQGSYDVIHRKEQEIASIVNTQRLRAQDVKELKKLRDDLHQTRVDIARMGGVLSTLKKTDPSPRGDMDDGMVIVQSMLDAQNEMMSRTYESFLREMKATMSKTERVKETGTGDRLAQRMQRIEWQLDKIVYESREKPPAVPTQGLPSLDGIRKEFGAQLDDLRTKLDDAQSARDALEHIEQGLLSSSQGTFTDALDDLLREDLKDAL
jgi:hypothetical protein